MAHASLSQLKKKEAQNLTVLQAMHGTKKGQMRRGIIIMGWTHAQSSQLVDGDQFLDTRSSGGYGLKIIK